MLRFKRFLIGQELTWIFERINKAAHHTIQGLKTEILRLDFTSVHRPGQMLADCDTLSRRNTWMNKWHKEEETNKWRNEQQWKEATCVQQETGL